MDLCGKFALLFALPVSMAIFNSGLSAVNLIKSDGYPLESHHVTTEDGYILELHRISRGRNESNPRFGRKKVAFFGQCLLCSSNTFVTLGPTRGLAYIVANAGYDVWLLNVRGSRHSQKHVSLSPQSDEFWKFSWHENGIYDLPASIDYVLKLTGESQVDYIGYSMGSTMFFAFMSERPEYSAKIRSMVSISPPVYFTDTSGLLPNLSPLVNEFAKFFANIRKLYFPPPELRLNNKIAFVCNPSNGLLFRPICDILLRAISSDGRNIEQRMLPFFFSTYPGTTSVRTVIHYAQLMNSGRFEHYDFGRKMNMVKYGSLIPPLYNLSRINIPISIFHGENDIFAPKRDVRRLISDLPNVQYSKLIPSYSHFDFVWARNAHRDVYKGVLSRLIATGSSQC